MGIRSSANRSSNFLTADVSAVIVNHSEVMKKIMDAAGKHFALRLDKGPCHVTFYHAKHTVRTQTVYVRYARGFQGICNEIDSVVSGSDVGLHYFFRKCSGWSSGNTRYDKTPHDSRRSVCISASRRAQRQPGRRMGRVRGH